MEVTCCRAESTLKSPSYYQHRCRTDGFVSAFVTNFNTDNKNKNVFVFMIFKDFTHRDEEENEKIRLF